MPDKQQHINPEERAALIRKYLAGELDDKAMHALERAALDDPFLAEALEGYAAHNPDQSAHLADLESRLQQRVAQQAPASAPGRVRSLYYRWAAAAALLLLLGLSAVWIWRQQIPRPREVARVETTPAAPQPADSPAAAVKEAAPPAPADSPQTTIARSAPPPARPEQGPANRRAAQEPADSKTATARAKQPAAVMADRADTPADVALAMKERNMAYMAQQDSMQEESLAAANASRMVTPVPTRVRSYSAARKGPVATDAPRKGATPVTGFERYARYLADSVRYPAGARAQNISGEVRVAFYVSPGGQLTNFRIVQSLHPACDAEAIRLIKEGPKWVAAAAPTPWLVEVTVSFKP